jgi:enoyl-CoA hydratase/carnithine racemase
MQAMAQAGVRVEHEGHVAVVTLDRPERRNALDEAMWASLARAVDELATSRARAIVVTGAGDRAFCAGQDVNPDNPQIAALVGAVQTGDRAPVEVMLRRMRDVVDRLVSLPVPIVAALNGLAFGGGAELAVRCDLRVADPAAVLCFSEVKLGLMPDWGGGVALTRLVGPSRAADLILTARRLGAGEALTLGVVNRVSAPGACLPEAMALAGSIAKNGPRAVRAALEVIRRAGDLDEAGALALELDRAAGLIASGECVHGITAFMTRTDPTFPD